ncbi:hypothetical protein U9M48_024135 [Paspalum notatum var. saurae]|uniref:Uncharacterized protein n=1 Tax=Paspalum notatum var. saurae TaxID=547442 RepID=A0AAQ3WVQ1_PASNO
MKKKRRAARPAGLAAPLLPLGPPHRRGPAKAPPHAPLTSPFGPVRSGPAGSAQPLRTPLSRLQAGPTYHLPPHSLPPSRAHRRWTSRARPLPPLAAHRLPLAGGLAPPLFPHAWPARQCRPTARRGPDSGPAAALFSPLRAAQALEFLCVVNFSIEAAAVSFPLSKIRGVRPLSGPLTATSSFAEPPRTLSAGSWTLGAPPRHRPACARRRRPPPLAAGSLHHVSSAIEPLDVDPPVEFEEQPPEASEQQQGINFEEGKYNINNT